MSLQDKAAEALRDEFHDLIAKIYEALEAASASAWQEAPEDVEQADSHALICSKLAEQYKSDPLLFAALTDAAAIIRDLLRELRRETERRWEGNRRAAQEHVEDMRDVLKERKNVKSETAAFPSVVAAKQVASNQLAYYRSMISSGQPGTQAVPKAISKGAAKSEGTSAQPNIKK